MKKKEPSLEYDDDGNLIAEDTLSIETRGGVENMVGDLATVIAATVDSFCAHPATPEFSFGHVLSALTSVMAVKMKQSGIITEEQIEAGLDNTWGDSGKAFFNNWLGAVYKLTHRDRGKVFDDGVDPEDPLGLLKRGDAP